MAAFVQDHWVSTLPFNSAPTSYTTAVPLTEDPISEGSKWLNGLTDGLDWNNVQTAAGQAYSSLIDTDPGGTSDGLCILKTSVVACTRAQFARATWFRKGGYNPSGTHECALRLLSAVGPHTCTGYEWLINSTGGSELVRWNGAHGDFTLFGSTSGVLTPANGDDMLFTVDAFGNFNCYQNGLLVGGSNTSPDTTFTSGQPGMGHNPCNNGTATVTAMGFSSWTGGNL